MDRPRDLARYVQQMGCSRHLVDREDHRDPEQQPPFAGPRESTPQRIVHVHCGRRRLANVGGGHGGYQADKRDCTRGTAPLAELSGSVRILASIVLGDTRIVDNIGVELAAS